MTEASPPTERPSLLIKPAWIDRTKPLDWFWSRFGEVYPGEGFSATLLALNAFLLMTVFFLLKTLRESLIVAEGGATARSYAGAVQAFILIFAVVAYGALASRLDRVKLISTVTAFGALNLFIFAALDAMGHHIAIAFYLWLGVFNLLVISQFWSFSTDVYSEEQGKRLFPFIGAGSVLGALAGARLGGVLSHALGVPGALASGGLVLVASLAVTALVNKFVCDCGGPQAIIASLPVGKQGGFELLRGSRYLLLVAVFTLFSNMISTSGDFLLSVQVRAEAGASATSIRNWAGAFYSRYFMFASLAALVLQLVAAGYLLRRVGAPRALLILPAITIVNNVGLMVFQQNSWLLWTRVFETGLENSVQAVAGHALFLGASRAVKYKAKAAIDAFFWRTGDILHGGLVWLGAGLGLQLTGFLQLNVFLCFVWIAVVVLLVREADRMKATRPAWRIASAEE